MASMMNTIQSNQSCKVKDRGAKRIRSTSAS
ncbi:hypothetical protein CCACVL1_21289 [Corchorus capsularis]|uniref:Uncharacterized protein n=1 Tax=Corchorus capsularis TaxID=210143 RepID=A0A1R3H7F4_COCAP|nr:hypothetical protein CCACVL1_21289 [Corchorus capsularis]